MRPVGARLLHLLLLYRYTSQTVSYFDRISRGHTRAHHIHCLRLKGRLRCPAVTLTATVDYVAWTIRTLRSRLLPLLSFALWPLHTLASCSLYEIRSRYAPAESGSRGAFQRLLI